MSNIVFLNGKNEVVTDSLMVAEVFGKRHDDVLKAIVNLVDKLSEDGKRNFAECDYINVLTKSTI
ncbi:Rha family transcriptional regulator [Bacillus toyonensis]|uniref:Rha family transcriptional regulator n=1 Tax=Bacillus toyonensis TaxID=155322 RepID=UPI00211E3BAF|nr:Rha family transcriptional regulator [Bacillus toyonensis]